MKLHTKLDSHQISDAMTKVKQAGLMSDDIFFVQFKHEPSKSRPNGYLIQLGTYDKTSGPKNSRHYKNSGQHGADSVWAATYDEWGWFIAEIFDRDPNAKFGYYSSRDDFNQKTNRKFE